MATYKTRREKDSLGTRVIPASAYYGIQTDRAIENFPISCQRHHPTFVDAYVILKKAAALANMSDEVLGKQIGRAIVRACDEILQGHLRDQFVVDVFQMGAGTSFHMNVNEVLANRASELLGGRRGEYKKVHPNDHVNMGQSTNDTFPTAMRLAVLLLLRDHFEGELKALAVAFSKKGKAFDRILKSARTHLMDAVPIRLGQEFAAYASALRASSNFLKHARTSLCVLGIGGSAVGTGLNTSKRYRQHVIRHLRELTALPLEPTSDLREAMQSLRPFAEVSAALRNLALEVNRIANDLRLLSSGPTTGLAEIQLPPVAPGSSIMPGKVNPSMLEMTNMVCYQVIGCDTTVALAVQAGQLELNVMMPVVSSNMNYMLQIFGNCLKQLRARCVDGITANQKQCQLYAERSMGLATALNPYIGYANAAEVAKQALREKKTIVEVIREKGILPPQELEKIMNPVKMTEPSKKGSSL